MVDRPSTASSSASTHKRTISKAANAYDTQRGAANNLHVIALFLRNCRLLNLDRLEDWPDVTVANVSQDARARTRCAEWCLFQLFRRYDSATTQEKLQPFFPPLEPLQSINLRAALFRCLNELKKDGVLGRETVLRKSMLDDCQGDKFWELCLSFSGLVLRRVTVEKKDRLSYERPYAEKIGTKKALSIKQRESMLPLAIAHKAALAKVLEEKKRKNEAYDGLWQTFKDQEVNLRVRKIQVHETAGLRRRRSPEDNVAQEVLENQWVGSEDVKDALINGDAAPGADGLLTKSFNAVWDSNRTDQLAKADPTEKGLLEDLEDRTRQQKRRLQRWQDLHEQLLKSKVQSAKDDDAATAKPSQLRLDQHQNLTLHDMADIGQMSTIANHKKHTSAAKYDEILTAMRDELRKKSANDPASPTKPVQRVKRPEFKRPSVSVDTTARAPPEVHQRANSHTSVPLRFGQRVSSRSRSYQQPKVINQREPIPLKSEIFSPLKTDRASSISPSPQNSIVASPAQESLIEDQYVPQRRRNGSDTGFASIGTAALSRASSGRNSPRVASRLSISESSSDSPIDPPALQLPVGRNADGMSRPVRASLVDRTRMSMAFKSTDSIELNHGATGKDDGERKGFTRSDTPIGSDETITTLSTVEEKPALSLQERTRQSISFAPQQSAPPKQPSHARSRTSQIYPVNQFDTPEKRQPRRFTVNQLDKDAMEGASYQRRDITPREKLFEEDVEYTSIFKARPKLARSPNLSPFPDSGHGSRESKELDNDLSFADDDIALSSPLKGR
ncbi:hypothetical protein CERZMDRAFT_80401 [Cercospora zeae-maydis SCOH1-5]|uniref:HAUS augmin-like complex subunit 6 N-terminal domain-containing protein n=1 Tax=Cercospora zeae-maydis SCOH1-5 TaxID=717836 RepID=A0A6A6FWC1_9PEZI|nr:hypothetical protein CERZMDRAFT_80401 [Cercospora zeae-maydis SCOH1-5]